MFLALITIFSSCSEETKEPPEAIPVHKDFIHVKGIGYVRKVVFEGHQYILMTDGHNRAGICHDENCPCKTNSN